MDVDPEDYHRYYRTLQRRRRRDAGPYRQYCVSAAGLDVPALWQGDDRRGHPLIGVSGYRLTETSRANSYTSEVSWLINVIYLTQAHQRLCALRVVRTLVGWLCINYTECRELSKLYRLTVRIRTVHIRYVEISHDCRGMWGKFDHFGLGLSCFIGRHSCTGTLMYLQVPV